ncbi:MAG: bifunctional glutamate N-acetyltransferase/amino-acid acetyltransferase ArgJ [Armatimonadota bacterium]|nr:bifunctional glutamate N-acetyltransferase/amino-acid acetyltransferase ArgJ [Armatimonadota bacterium]MDR5702995.1 bifunctional glutamate N-acetyltransferase/amino-acid acetyltransferase ArgJ [Armatimonadota bacterium]MDR7433707.1 bifunctional glutamate N-acetyltransferase/amino-acid acetyltransferase ArgJ [Armatimonadota bacterium]
MDRVKRIEGTVTTPKGFLAAGVHCGIKKESLDLALVYSTSLAAAAGVFTRNQVKAAPVQLSRQRVPGYAQAIVINSGNANACTGLQGLADAEEMARLVAESLGISPEHVLVASTGVIGVPLPMERIRKGIEVITQALGPNGEEAARAIMTTDSFPKMAAVQVEIGGTVVTVGGMAKGAGMIHPSMATTLCVMTTDAAIEPHLLQVCLEQAIDRSFNAISVDGDTSTNDSAFLLANGLAKNPPIRREGEEFARLQAAVDVVAGELSKLVVRDGEGATKLVEVRVKGALEHTDARKAAEAIATSLLVKTALYGGEPNWGRIMAAVGRSGARIQEDRITISICGEQVVVGGVGVPGAFEAAAEKLKAKEVVISVDLGLGPGEATMWTCDLTEEYVRINSGYMT